MAIKIKSKVKSKEVILPLGIILNGERYNTCVVESMDGNSEELVSDRKIRNNGAKIITELLATKIKKVGDIDFPNGIGEKIAREMFSGDRDTCLFAIRSLMSDEIEVEFTCPVCESKETLVLNIDEILEENEIWKDCPLDELGILDFELEDGLIIENDETGEELECKKGKIKLITGKIEEGLARYANNMGTANTLTISSCIIELENIRKVTPDVVRAMTKVDRDCIGKVLMKNKFGPKPSGQTNCSNCGSDAQYAIKFADFFTAKK